EWRFRRRFRRPGKAASAMGVVAGIGVLILALSSGILSQAPGGFGFFFVLLERRPVKFHIDLYRNTNLTN
ncbi:MAG: hypothetical protein ACRDIA_03625, partial [Actinomycetota bacterium]